MGSLFFLFIVVPVFELWLLARIALRVGVLPVVGFTVIAAVFGVTIASVQGRRAARTFGDEIAAGRVPHLSVISSVLVLCAGLLFIVPGVVTDVLGLALLVPFVRNPLARRIAQRVGLPTNGMPNVMGGVGRARTPRTPPTEVGRVYVREGDVIDTTGEEVEPETGRGSAH